MSSWWNKMLHGASPSITTRILNHRKLDHPRNTYSCLCYNQTHQILVSFWRSMVITTDFLVVRSINHYFSICIKNILSRKRYICNQILESNKRHFPPQTIPPPEIQLSSGWCIDLYTVTPGKRQISEWTRPV